MLLSMIPVTKLSLMAESKAIQKNATRTEPQHGSAWYDRETLNDDAAHIQEKPRPSDGDLTHG